MAPREAGGALASRLVNTYSPEDVLHYWFGDLETDESLPEDRRGLWWGKDPTTDWFIRQTFEPTLTAARRGMLDAWADQPRSALALVVVLDQLSRNMYRDKPPAFENDEACQGVVLGGLAAGFPEALRPLERVFFYMPLMHAEDLALQERGVALFEALALAAPLGLRRTLDENADFARRHRDIIQRFGRFPHRNAILGRATTPEEAAFLTQPGSSF